jgi:hypothetical protein
MLGKIFLEQKIFLGKTFLERNLQLSFCIIFKGMSPPFKGDSSDHFGGKEGRPTLFLTSVENTVL